MAVALTLEVLLLPCPSSHTAGLLGSLTPSPFSPTTTQRLTAHPLTSRLPQLLDLFLKDVQESVQNGDIMTSIADAASSSSQLQDASVDADSFSYGDYTEIVYDDDGDEDGGDEDGTAAAASVNTFLVVALAVMGALAVLAACIAIREKRRTRFRGPVDGGYGIAVPGHHQVGHMQEAVVHEVQAFPVHDNQETGKEQPPSAVELVPLGNAGAGVPDDGLMTGLLDGLMGEWLGDSAANGGVQSAQLVVSAGEGQVAKL